MSNAEQDNQPDRERDEGETRGPNLVLIYILVGLALLAAISIALLIVFPFYLRR